MQFAISSPLMLALSATLAGTAVAQSSLPQPGGALPQAVPTMKYAGVYHVASGTWTRPTVAFAGLGTESIYCNTAQSGYFTTAGSSGGFASGGTNFDEGGLPGTTNGNSFAVGPNRDSYNVTGFQIGYCDFGPPQSAGWEISFYESYTPCTFDPSPTATVLATGLRAGGCWTIDIDLTGGQEFTLVADGGSWDDDPTTDSFGWSFRHMGSPGVLAGFLLAGDPANTEPNYMAGGLPLDGTGTYYGAPSLCGADGSTGYLNQDSWWLEDTAGAGTSSGCFAFGGYANMNGCGGPTGRPYTGFYMELFAEEGDDPMEVGSVYCNSNPNSTGVNTSLSLLGSSVAADDTVRMTAGNLVPGSLGFFITSQEQGFVANAGGGEGNLCVVGQIGRFLRPQQVKFADAAGETSIDTSLGEWTLTDIPGPIQPLNYAAMSGVTTNFQFWHRDLGAGGATSNFSDGVTVTWE